MAQFFSFLYMRIWQHWFRMGSERSGSETCLSPEFFLLSFNSVPAGSAQWQQHITLISFYTPVDNFDVSTLSFHIPQAAQTVLLNFLHRSYFVNSLPSCDFKASDLFSIENPYRKLKGQIEIKVQIYLILPFLSTPFFLFAQ